MTAGLFYPPEAGSGRVDSPGRPAWAPYRPQAPEQCAHCVLAAYAIRTFDVTPSRARWRRTHAGDVLLLCSLHAQSLRERDALMFPAR